MKFRSYGVFAIDWLDASVSRKNFVPDRAAPRMMMGRSESALFMLAAAL